MQINSRTKDLELKPEFSEELKDLLSKILCKDPEKRPNIFEVKEHHFFKKMWNNNPNLFNS